MILARLACATLVTLSLLSAAGSAAASWTKLANSEGSNLFEPTMLRTSDGLLHVAYRDPRGGLAENYLHSTVSKAGKISTPTTVLPIDWKDLNNPTLVQLSDGRLGLVFAGLAGFDPYNGKAALAVSSDGGTTWALEGGALTDRDAYDSDNVGATVAGDGTLHQSYSGTFGTYTHAGMLPGTASVNHVSACCGYSTSLATDAVSKQLFLAWFSDVGTKNLYFKNLTTGATGALPGGATKFSGTPSALSLSRSMPLVARTGGGVYAAYGSGYPSYTSVRVTRLGTSSATVGTGGGIGEVAMAKGPSGRLWVFWSSESGKDAVLARRSNVKATKWGAVVRVPMPASQPSIFRLAGEGSGGPLDLFAHLSAGSDATWRARVLPGLTVTPIPSKIPGGQTTAVTVAIADAGVPVAGALVLGGGDSATTKATGLATLHLKPGSTTRRVTVIAVREGYAAGRSLLRVTG